MEKPGVMFYFDVRPCIKRLSCEEKGRLFEAILDYGELGTVPEFDGVLGIAWDFIQPRLDNDSERYGQKLEQRKYAVYVREAKKHGVPALTFGEWVVVPDDQKQRLISADIGSYPTTTTTSTSTSASASATKPDICMGADKPPTRARKKYGSFGWVKLTEDEYSRLVADLGEQEAKRCIDYLDEAAQSSGNKNRWRDWNLVIRRCHRDGWGLSKPSPARGGTPMPDYGGAEKWSL